VVAAIAAPPLDTPVPDWPDPRDHDALVKQYRAFLSWFNRIKKVKQHGEEKQHRSHLNMLRMYACQLAIYSACGVGFSKKREPLNYSPLFSNLLNRERALALMTRLNKVQTFTKKGKLNKHVLSNATDPSNFTNLSQNQVRRFLPFSTLLIMAQAR
jgi:hypothetical protein